MSTVIKIRVPRSFPPKRCERCSKIDGPLCGVRNTSRACAVAMEAAQVHCARTEEEQEREAKNPQPRARLSSILCFRPRVAELCRLHRHRTDESSVLGTAKGPIVLANIVRSSSVGSFSLCVILRKAMQHRKAPTPTRHRGIGRIRGRRRLRLPSAKSTDVAVHVRGDEPVEAHRTRTFP